MQLKLANLILKHETLFYQKLNTILLMQQQAKVLLCETENGRLGALNSGLAYELRYRNILLILTPQQLHSLKHYLENLDPEVWFQAPEEEFAFIYFAPLCANYYMTRDDLAEMLNLLLEATAMVKVHQRLYLKNDKSRIN